MRRREVSAGERFGRLTTVTARLGDCIEAICDCGKKVSIADVQRLFNGMTSSCGCLRREVAGDRARTHGLSGTPEHRSWVSMRARCKYPSMLHFKDYGGRGLRVCERWDSSFESFLEDMGPKPSPQHSIDRIDVNGNYEPSNCRWATSTEQAFNTRRTKCTPDVVRRVLELRATGLKQSDIAELVGMDQTTVSKALRRAR